MKEKLRRVSSSRNVKDDKKDKNRKQTGSARWLKSLFHRSGSKSPQTKKKLTDRLSPSQSKFPEYISSSDNTDSIERGNTPSPRPLKRKYSHKEIFDQSLTELKLVTTRRKSDLDEAEHFSRDVIRNSQTFQKEGNVNHVWSVVYDEKKDIRGFYKSGRNGNVRSAYMECIVYDIAIQFGVDKYFAPTKISGLSPRSQKNLKVKNKRDSINDLGANSNLEVSFQKGVPGKELRYICEDLSPFEWYKKYYPTLPKESIIPKYRKAFLKANVAALIFGFWDAHSKNIILNKNGFSWFDNARSFPHSNFLIIRGDTVRLPYNTYFMGDNGSYKYLTHDDLHILDKECKKYETNYTAFKNYLHSNTAKKLVAVISEKWFNRKIIIETTNERIKKLRLWINQQKMNLQTNNLYNSQNLLDLTYYIFPYYKFMTVLMAISKIDELITPVPNFEDLWRVSTNEVGNNYDNFELIDTCAQKGFDPYLIFDECMKQEFSSLLLDIIIAKQKKYGPFEPEFLKKRANQLKVRLVNDAKTDYTESGNTYQMMASFMRQYCEWADINIFIMDDHKIPDECMEKSLHACVKSVLFRTGYFVSFYSIEKEVICTVCGINSKGIEIKDYKVSYYGEIFIQMGRKWKTLEEFTVELQKYQGNLANTKITDTIDELVTEYEIYYEEVYLLKVVQKLQLNHIILKNYSLNEYKEVGRLKNKYMDNDGYYILFGSTIIITINDDNITYHKIEEMLKTYNIRLSNQNNSDYNYTLIPY